LRKFGQFDGKIILSFHGSDIRAAASSTGTERSLWRVLLRGADHIAVVSDELGRSVLALEPKVAGKLRTIHSGVDLAMFASARRDRELLRPDANQGPTVICVGGFVAIKGHDVLVQAFSRVVEEVSHAHLLLVGKDGPEVPRIRELVNSLSLADRVEICQDVPHERIPAYLSRASLFASASRAEGFPLAVIEAAAAGLPVVCTRATGLRELVADRVTGRLVGIDDHIGLADAIIDLLTHTEEMRRMAANLYRFVSSQLTWQHVYQSYIETVVPPVPS